MQMLYAINALCIIRHSKQEEHQGFNTPLGSPLPGTRAPRKRGDATQKAPQGILQRPATQPANYGEPEIVIVRFFGHIIPHDHRHSERGL